MPPWAFAFGKGKGGFKGNWITPTPYKKPPTIAADFEVDPETVFTGTVSFYHKWKGYGFINVREEGVVPGNAIWVHWRNVQSLDRFPFLIKDMEVQFNIQKWREPGAGMTLRAKNVATPGGADISIQDEVDGKKKEFVGGQDLRYTGNLKFYSPRSGFGYITIDAGYELEEGVPTELRVERSEVNAGGRQPPVMQNTQVEFGIWKTNKGGYKAYNMTLPGGMPVSQAALENRLALGADEYQGIVEIWNWKQAYGFLKLAPDVVLPAAAAAKLTQQTQAATEKAKAAGKTDASSEELIYFRRTDVQQGIKLEKGQTVTFQIYMDDKGVGAMEIH